MTILEQHFMERVPNILLDLVKELKKLNDNLEKLAEKKENENEKK